MTIHPPPLIEIRWCPECGQTDTHKTMGATVHKHVGNGGWCYGKTEVITYGRVRVDT